MEDSFWKCESLRVNSFHKLFLLSKHQRQMPRTPHNLRFPLELAFNQTPFYGLKYYFLPISWRLWYCTYIEIRYFGYSFWCGTWMVQLYQIHVLVIAIYKQPFFTSFICFDFVFIHLDLQFFVISFFFNFNILSSSMIYI